MLKKEYLLLLAGVVWTIAGINILRIGILSYVHYISLWNLGISFIVFLVFQFGIFGKLVRKHTKRILAYAEEKKQWFYFFDRKSFLIMAVMISAGIYFRFCGYVPMEWIAVFYSGLGTALCMAGILFILQYQKQKMIQKEAIQNETIL